jgi:AbrB family looped-hinge helix DNA binding protein
MAKVTSKLQVTVPKAVADRFGIRPGDQIEWRIEGSAIRVLRGGEGAPLTVAERLRLLDDAAARQVERNRAWRRRHGGQPPRARGWTREEIYHRGRAR